MQLFEVTDHYDVCPGDGVDGLDLLPAVLGDVLAGGGRVGLVDAGGEAAGVYCRQVAAGGRGWREGGT